MLILTRRTGEAIRVNGPCDIVLVESRKGRARIGLEMDDDTKAVRSELLTPKTDPQPENEKQ